MSGTFGEFLAAIDIRNRIINEALNLTDSLAKSDDSLLRLLTNSVVDMHSKDIEELKKERRRLLYELLRDATETMLRDKNKGRAIILTPGALNGDKDFLTILAYHKVSEQTISRTKFYIGGDETKNFERGTVGVAFLEKRIRIGSMIKKGDRWECTDEHYYVFDEHRVAPPYETFINVPIIGPSKNGDINCLGIFCMDTKLYNAFNSRKDRVTAEAISRRIASILSIYEEIINFH